MKTTFFIATAIFISSIASAQEAHIRSNSSSGTAVAGSSSGAAVKSSTQNTTVVKSDAGDQKSKNRSALTVSSGQDNKSSAGTSIKTTNIAGADMSASEPENIRKLSNSIVNQSVETSGDVVTHTRHSVHAQSESTLSAGQSATKKAHAKAKRSARVNANTDASVNGHIRPVPFKTSSMISGRAGLGL